MADEYDIQQSLQDQSDDFLMQNRQYAWIADSNNGSYSGGQVVLDCSGIANSGKYLSCAQSYIQVPLVMTLNSLASQMNNVTGENNFAASLKNGYHQLIHSMNAELGNNSVVSTSSYTNMAINYQLLTCMSREDELNFGTTIGFSKDEALSMRYLGVANGVSLGEVNNIITKVAFDPSAGYGASGYLQNQGRLNRMINSTSYDVAMETTENLAQVIGSGKNYSQSDAIVQNPGVVTGTVVNYYIIATIPLHNLCDLFAKMPLVKGAYLKITLNLNANCSTTIVNNAAGTSFVSVTSSSQNGVVPYMISPLSVTGGTGFNTGATVPTSSCMLSIGVAKNSFSGTTYNHPTLSSCRLYACLYDLSPSCETMYLSKLPTKVVKYQDFMSFQTLNVAAGGSFSQVLTNGITRVRKLIGIPQISGSFNYAGPNLTISPLASPFTSSPATSTGQSITNFNVLLSGVQLYNQNYNYSIEHFYQELRKINSTNGGSSIGMSSGLLSQTDFENGYRFITADLSRKPSEAVDNIAKSIQCIGTNSGLYPIDIFWFVFYEREIEIDIQTGSLIA